MPKIFFVSVSQYREIFIRFHDGIEGHLHLDEQFIGVAEPLNDPKVFATAHIIDEGYGIGFDNCEYDICAMSAYEEIAHQAIAVA